MRDRDHDISLLVPLLHIGDQGTPGSHCSPSLRQFASVSREFSTSRKCRIGCTRSDFFRRSTVTLIESTSTLQRLGECPEFKALRKTFDEEQDKRWASATEFFGKHHKVLKAIRNDCGGEGGPRGPGRR
jgi:hypothetical protein